MTESQCPKCGPAVAAERQRCVDIVQAARFDEVDRDWRAIIVMIEGGESAEALIKRAAEA